MEAGESHSPPHQALFFVLAYLPLQQLLLMSQVSKSLGDAIRDDLLIWLNLVVEKPLSLRLTDQILIQITSKAHGRLQTLALLQCVKITDDGLLQVVNANPLLTKLYVPACTGLTPEGIIRAVKSLTIKPTAFTSIKINGIYNINKDNLLILQSHIPQTTLKQPRFYHKYWSSSFHSLDDDIRAIDVEICPKCEEVKLVFHCPREAECMGCLQCIPRCGVCGRCISDQDEDEQSANTICNDPVCLVCWLRLPKCNHCNKPFCGRHAHEQLHHPSSQGFICEVCQAKPLSNSW